MSANRRASFFRRPLHVLARELHYHPLRLLIVLTLSVLVLGGLAIFVVERAGGSTLGFWDSMWLAAVSTTTSEPYGTSPATVATRVILVLMAFAGITLSGSFVAALTPMVIHEREPDYEHSEFKRICERLDRIEEQLKKLEEHPAR